MNAVRNRPAHYILVALASVAISVLAGYLSWVEKLNWNIYDHFQKAQAKNFPASDSVALITIDEVSLANCADRAGKWPWRRDAYAALLISLDTLGAKAVGIDLLFNEPATESYHDDLLYTVIQAIETPVVLARLKGKELASPFNQWPLTGDVDLANDNDGITRRTTRDHSLAGVLSVQAGNKNSIPPELLRFYGPFNDTWAKRSFQAGPLVISGYKILEEASKQIDVLDPGKLRAWLTEHNKSSPGKIAEKPLAGITVIVGLTAAGTFDVKATPTGKAEAGMVIHATALRNLLESTGVSELPDQWVLLLSFVGSLLMAAYAWTTPRVSLLTAITLAALPLIYFLSGRLLAGGYWLPPVVPMSAILLSAFGGIVLNYRTETLRKKEITGLFGRFVSPTVVQTLIDHPELASPGGREEICTVFFSDLAGFTTISEKLSPPVLVELINEYLEVMSRTVLDHGGTIDKYIGDAVMAFWNAPMPQADHAVRACSTALRCERATREMAVRFREKYDVELFTRFGLHTGPVVVGPIGSSIRLDYTVLGDTVNLSSRLEGANKNYGTTFLITQATKELTGDTFAWRPVDLLRVKGKQEPIAVFELLGFSGDVTGKDKTALEHFLRGYDQYRSRRFAAALGDFKLAIEEKNGDNLYSLYRQRTLCYIDQPPAPDWDGVYTMTTK